MKDDAGSRWIGSRAALLRISAVEALICLAVPVGRSEAGHVRIVDDATGADCNIGNALSFKFLKPETISGLRTAERSRAWKDST